MIAPEKKHFANCGDLMSAMSWQFVAASKHLVAASSIIQKRCRAAQEKVDVAMSRD